MEHPSFLFLATEFLLLFLITASSPAHSLAYNNFTDLSSLLSFKSHVTDPNGILDSNWTTDTSFCRWTGISCSHRRQRVTSLTLSNFSLQGNISPQLANLSFLSLLDLSVNSLTGHIPGALGHLPRLSTFILSDNFLVGSIPCTVFNMSSLIELYLGSNNLSGPLTMNNHTTNHRVPLQLISVSINHHIGEIPWEFDWCPELQVLDFTDNKFHGNIPAELGSIPKLRVLYLAGNRLTGKIPASLGNLSTTLHWLALGDNNLQGQIPEEFGNLLNLQILNLAQSGLTGPIPISLLNASKIYTLALYQNMLTGPVPARIGSSMPQLYHLLLAENNLTGGLEFIDSLSSCRRLEFLDVSENLLEGVLTDSVGNLSSNLQYFHTEQNHIRGKIPAALGNLSNLIFLTLDENHLIGVIPPELARLQKLQVMYLGVNILIGSVPSELGLMTNLNVLSLLENKISGPIPASLGNISMLQHLILADNELSASIPQILWNLRGLIELNLSRNSLDGSLPLQISNLKVLDKLDLSKNRLSGNITVGLGELQMLTHLDLSGNSFQGPIPQSVGALISLSYVNLSHNFLSGAIPKTLANLKYVTTLDLSFNKLEGPIPEGRVFSNLSIATLIGNVALCGAPQLNFPSCSTNLATSKSRRNLHFLLYVLPAVSSIILLLACLYLFLKFRRRTQAESPIDNDMGYKNDHRLISYLELVRATDNFSEANILGRGSFSTVFKACLDDGLIAAVKVLNTEVKGALRSFDTECHALSTVRHRNLVKIITTCSNLDFKALILQFMTNGSLQMWLYSEDRYLDLQERINIMVDVSLALEYLHHYHPQVVVHRDLKPSNVLLDENMVASVGDFGIAKLLHGVSGSVMSTTAPGTIGYMAPEYGFSGKYSRSSDVYSFGILLLETFTGKKPTDAMFNGESSLRQWVCNRHPAGLLEIVDSKLILREESEVCTSLRQCLSSILELGLLCSRESPNERISMKDAVPILQKIRLDYTTNSSGALGQVQRINLDDLEGQTFVNNIWLGNCRK